MFGEESSNIGKISLGVLYFRNLSDFEEEGSCKLEKIKSSTRTPTLQRGKVSRRAVCFLWDRNKSCSGAPLLRWSTEPLPAMRGRIG